MKRIIFALMMATILALGATGAQAGQNGNGNGHRVAAFVDENGDGFNDLAPDADGDGIPNGLDPDYERPRDGSGPGLGPNAGGALAGADGFRRMSGWAFHRYFSFGPIELYGLTEMGNRHGPADGSGFGGVSPADGSGFGPGTGTGTGDCDGTGPNGQQGTPNDRGNRRGSGK